MQHPGGSLSKRGDRPRRSSSNGRCEKRRAVVAGVDSPARRPSRPRRCDDAPSRCDSRTPSDAQRLSRRRFVKSKPPKCMPGGRVIPSGDGTLTEVFKSFYVAYGSTALGPTAPPDVHLVVPVNDELQEVSDEEQQTTLLLLQQQQQRQLRSTKEVQAQSQDVWGDVERSPFDEMSASLMPSSPPAREDSTVIPPRLSSDLASAQLPLNYYGSRPSWHTVRPSVLPFMPYSGFDPQIQGASDFEDSAGASVDALSQQQPPPQPDHPLTHQLSRSGYSQGSSGSFSTELSRMRVSQSRGDAERDCVSTPLSPRTLGGASPDFVSPAGEDISYFNLADELMPETRSSSTSRAPFAGAFHPPPPPPVWDSSAMPFHQQRCGMTYGELTPFPSRSSSPAPHGYNHFTHPPPPPSSQTGLSLPVSLRWEAEMMLPPLPLSSGASASPSPQFRPPSSSSFPYLSYPPKHASEIMRPRPFPFPCYGDRHGFLQTSPNLLT